MDPLEFPTAAWPMAHSTWQWSREQTSVLLMSWQRYCYASAAAALGCQETYRPKQLKCMEDSTHSVAMRTDRGGSISKENLALETIPLRTAELGHGNSLP